MLSPLGLAWRLKRGKLRDCLGRSWQSQHPSVPPHTGSPLIPPNPGLWGALARPLGKKKRLEDNSLNFLGSLDGVPFARRGGGRKELIFTSLVIFLKPREREGRGGKSPVGCSALGVFAAAPPVPKERSAERKRYKNQLNAGNERRFWWDLLLLAEGGPCPCCSPFPSSPRCPG